MSPVDSRLGERSGSGPDYAPEAGPDSWPSEAIRAASATARIVIVGGGFGGLAAASAVARAPVEVLLIDAQNHHLKGSGKLVAKEIWRGSRHQGAALL